MIAWALWIFWNAVAVIDAASRLVACAWAVRRLWRREGGGA